MTFFKVTYFHSLYKRNVTVMTDEVRFEGGIAYFKHMGCGEAINIDKLVNIESVEE